jgi:DNA-binding transcriptional MerR regulator
MTGKRGHARSLKRAGRRKSFVDPIAYARLDAAAATLALKHARRSLKREVDRHSAEEILRIAIEMRGDRAGPPPRGMNLKNIHRKLRQLPEGPAPERPQAQGAKLTVQWDQHWKDLDRSRRANEKRINAKCKAAGLPPIQLFDFNAVLVQDPKTGKLRKLSLTTRGKTGRQAIQKAGTSSKRSHSRSEEAYRRHAAGFNETEIARSLGVTERQIRRYLTGK